MSCNPMDQATLVSGEIKKTEWHLDALFSGQDKMPALAAAQAGNDLDTLTLFCGTQTGGPAPSPVEQRIWILHE
ncbi:hypothetical protein NQZ68_002958 [Dissostichus eleginoides]|nr:hypothetical protein NQZ68_002958 [Dissostichus eleginoides]